MSVLDLLGISDESFDGRSIDKDIGTVEGLSSNKYGEDEIESANAVLEEINDLVRNISSFERISDSYDQLVEQVEDMFSSLVTISQRIDKIETIINNIQYNDNLTANKLSIVEDNIYDIKNVLSNTSNLSLDVNELLSNSNYSECLTLKFLPENVYYSGSYYVNDNWCFEIGTTSSWRLSSGEFKYRVLTIKDIYYKSINFHKCFNKIKSSGFDPNNMTEEDGEFMKMVDSQGSEVYDLFISKT